MAVPDSVIDLTLDSSPPAPVNSRSAKPSRDASPSPAPTPAEPASRSQTPSKTPRRKKKKRKSEPVVDSSGTNSNSNSNADTNAREVKERKETDDVKDADLEDGEVLPAPVNVSQDDAKDAAPVPELSRSNSNGKRKKRKERPASSEREVRRDREGGARAETGGSRNRTRTKGRHRDRSPESRRAKRSTSIEIDENALFFVDVQPVPAQISVPAPGSASAPASSQLQSGSSKNGPNGAPLHTEASLLLPAHVSVLPLANGSSLPVEIIPEPEMGSEEEDFIEILDYDDRPLAGVVRYFEKQDEEPAKATTVVCKHCGAKGEHKTFECPILICLTCGARDEHSTRSCPISKTCFHCGLKGHIVQNCPTRHLRDGGRSRLDECARCGSSRHSILECPTNWRIYEYASTDERDVLLAAHAAPKDLKIGEGGEAYIATDDWCHYCGECGHLGDDCQTRDHLPTAFSAFGLYNVQAGPFYDPDDQRTQAIREPRDWEALDRAPDGWGLNAPLNVGQQARKRDKARMEERARQTNEDDPEDWFGSHRNARSRGMPPPKESRGRPPPKKPTFGPSFSSLARDGPSRDSSRYHDSRNGGGKDDRQSRDSGSSGLSIKGAHARTMDHQSSDSSYRDRDRYRDHSDHGRRDDSRRSDRSRHGHSRDYREDDRRDSRGSRGGDDRSLGGRDRDADFRPRYKGGYGR